MARLARGLIIAAPRSGSGKTVVTLGLQRAFAHAGHAVAGAKTGPDYIDPAFHAAASGRASLNLDGFAFTPSALQGLAATAARNVDLVIAEGAMGLFDGLSAGVRSGSTASVAAHLGWPIVLVLDASGSAQSIAAVAHGLASFPGAPSIAGAIVNRVASPRHAAMIRAGFEQIALPLLGMIPTDERMALPARHLGLVQAGETVALDARINGMAAMVREHCDLARIANAAGATADLPLPSLSIRPPGQRIAVARDDAFAFFYPHLLDRWQRSGAEIEWFSPLDDAAPPAGCDACWLPGGYPELHAERISANTKFLGGLAAFAEHYPIHGECGGYMVLGRSLESADGKTHGMAGLLPVETSFVRRKLHLGYRRATWRRDVGFALAGAQTWGHEYHHCSVIGGDTATLADIADAAGEALGVAGHGVGRVTGTFFHAIA